MELLVCSQEDWHHFILRLPTGSPLPGAYQDLDHPRKHCHSSCPLNCHSLSPSPRKTGRGGAGLLISPMWYYQVLPQDNLPRSAFEFHTVSVTLPFKLNIVVIYCPHSPLRYFFDEMDTILSCSPDDGTPHTLPALASSPRCSHTRDV